MMERMTKRDQRSQINQVLESRLAEMEDRERSLGERLTEVTRELEMKTLENKKVDKNYNKLWTRFEEALSYLADAECQEIKALERNAELKHNNSVLMEQRKALQGSLEQFQTLFYERHMIRDELLKSTLQNENKDLRNQVGVLQSTVSMLEERIKTHESGEEELMEQRQSQKDYYTLWAKYEEAVSSLVDAEAREKKTSEVIAELEHNNSVLMAQRETLKESVRHLRDLFSEHRKMRIQLMKCTLQNENKELKNQVGILQTKVRNLEGQLEIRRRGEEELMLNICRT